MPLALVSSIIAAPQTSGSKFSQICQYSRQKYDNNEEEKEKKEKEEEEEGEERKKIIIFTFLSIFLPDSNLKPRVILADVMVTFYVFSFYIQGHLMACSIAEIKNQGVLQDSVPFNESVGSE